MTPCLMVLLTAQYNLRKVETRLILAAQRQTNYLDFWQRLVMDNVKTNCSKTSTQSEGFLVWGHEPGWPESDGHSKNSM